MLPLVVVSPVRKEKKRNINNNLAVLPSHDKSVTNNQGYLFFIHAAGSCRKTFLYNTIVAKVRRKGQIVLCMASSRIAALLLDGERISYSCFKISLSIHEDSVAKLKCNSYMFPVLQQTKVIIWNEVPM